MLYEKIVKPILFRMNPETAHHLTISGLRIAQAVPGAMAVVRAAYSSPQLPELRQTLWGMDFPNPIGLAAGLDKNGEAAKAFSYMGFGFIEVGTVTPRAQNGNERPRLFRLPEDSALINRMGFNNEGADKMRAYLEKVTRRPIPIAINIGKNKVTPNEHAVQDYLDCLRILYDVGDFFAVNISSPNTPNLRKLQHGDDLRDLLHAVIAERDRLAKERKAKAKPVVVKIAPDLSDEEIEQCVETISQAGIDGIIATNTTIKREGLKHPNAIESGGLSGKPLKQRAVEVIRQVYRLTEGRIPILGSGGVFTGDDAYEMIRAGASLVEIYTSFIYRGPTINKTLNQELSNLLRRDGFTHISEAVGVDA
ncbi:dihydroorotate dehydrogenase (quinone) [Insulibacter thermoxylanivorax]|uniref:Dihydroorotate dehydrogenase (quinone) n=1 Tax=Insulibacter thermoxylanivorax TaxID=2749268 RepID=A0A916QD52_9BACL|nr:quinone-dependent dihydroorotate dehydrogenase [Insulibacter thermoxylanivorax]GFR38340.1 dihydroorotate dehydrogenase (quinone) [Insulibacter thermoxylanivorax]